MSKKLDLAALLSTPDAPVSKSDTLIMEIRMDLIDDNEDNFYNVGDVDALAESIQLVGLQQPLVVRRNGERFALIAGHRRRKALRQLGRESAPCIIAEDAGAADDAFAALRLIMTNSTARELTYFERSQQVRLIEAELVKLAERGIKLPGKMRDRVAEISQESAAEIARMKVIDDKLSKAWKRKLKNGQIAASVAYEIARLDEPKQQRLMQAFGNSCAELNAKAAKAAAVNYAYDWVPNVCPIKDTWHVDMCSRVEARAAYKAKRPECVGCCNKCSNASDCAMCCGKVAKRIDAKRTSEERRRQSETADEAFEKSTFAQVQRRFIGFLAGHGIEAPHQLKDRTGLEYWEISGALQCNRNISKLSLEAYCKIADSFDVSLSQLLGLDAVPAAAEPPRWRSMKKPPTEDCEVLLRFPSSSGMTTIREGYFHDGDFYIGRGDMETKAYSPPYQQWMPKPGTEEC